MFEAMAMEIEQLLAQVSHVTCYRIAVLFTGRICPKGSSASIVLTHGPIFRFFAQQGRHVAP